MTQTDELSVTARLAALGPQRLGEGLHLRRVRLHQAWYRAEVLGLPNWGHTSGNTPRALGSILTEADAAAGYNFTSIAARETYAERRTRGWGLEPVRCERYMTSSQTMTLNLFGPLLSDHSWLAAVIGRILHQKQATITGAWVEFGPPDRMQLIGDRAIADVFITGITDSAPFGVVVETKLADRFSQRFLDLATSSRHVALNKERHLWHVDDASLHDRSVNQLARIHALGTAYTSTTAVLLLIHHSGDIVTPRVADAYRSTLADAASLVVIDLDDFVQHINITAPLSAQADVTALKRRYVDFTESDWAWHALGHPAPATGTDAPQRS